MKLKEVIKNKKEIIIITILFIIAIILRTIYIQQTPYNIRQHDLWDLEHNGCLKYIYTIFETGALPTTNNTQFYHPPLHHMISAILLKIVNVFTTNQTIQFELLQVLPYLYSISLMFVVYKILKELKFKSLTKTLILTITALHPTYIILSGSINNDMLSIFLVHLAILLTIKWYKKTNLTNTILLAIITGAAVMAKTSGGIIAPSIATIFIWKVADEFIKNKKYKPLIKKYTLTFAIFGLISLSIGLWYPIRNYIKFNQPILTIMDPMDIKQYYGLIDFKDRITPSLSAIKSVYHDSYDNAENIYGAVIKTSMYGEYKFAKTGILHYLSLLSVIINFFLGLIIPIIIIISLFISAKNEDKDLKWKTMLFILFIVNIITFLIMQKQLPYGCSEDFRYIVPTIFTSIALLGYIQKDTKKTYIKHSITIIYILIIYSLIFADISIFTHI